MINTQRSLSSLTNARLIALYTCLAIWLWFCGVARSQTTPKDHDTQSSGKKTAKLYTKSYALVIGVNEPLGDWSPLKSAQQDAQIFADHLKQRDFDVTLLLGKEANKKEILKQLQTQLPQKVTADDRFIFYFAGHGQTQTLGKGKKVGYIVPVDGNKEAEQDEWHTYVSMRELRSLLTDYIVSKHTLLVFDSCFSGLMFTRGGLRRPSLNARSYLKRSGVMAITAGGEGELALDGLFTPTFIQALSGEADENEDGMTSFQELALYTRREVRSRQEDQNPQFGVISGSGQMIFDAKYSAQNILSMTDQSPSLSSQLDVNPSDSSSWIWTSTTIAGGLVMIAGTSLSVYAQNLYTDLKNEKDTVYNQKISSGEGTRIINQNNVGLSMLAIGGVSLGLGLYKLLSAEPNTTQKSSIDSDPSFVALIPNLLNQSIALEMTW